MAEKKIVRRKYPSDFKLKVAQEAEEIGVAEAAKKHKVAENNVYNWRNTFRTYGKEGFDGKSRVTARTGTSVTIKAALDKRLEKAAGAAVSQALREILGDEQKRRVEAEKALSNVRKQLQKILASI